MVWPEDSPVAALLFSSFWFGFVVSMKKLLLLAVNFVFLGERPLYRFYR